MGIFDRKKEKTVKEDIPWGFTNFKQFFNQEGQKKGNSTKFQAVVNAFEQYEKARGQVVSEQSAKEMALANQALLSACETYTKERAGARTSGGQERLDAISKLMDFQKQQNLDEIRDLRFVRGLMEEDQDKREKNPEHKDRTWEQVGPIRIPEVTITGNEDTVGDKVNKRFKVNYDGKVGFFTERLELNTVRKGIKDMVERVDKNTEPERRKLMEENYKTLIELFGEKLSTVTVENTKGEKVDEIRRAPKLHLNEISDPQMKFDKVKQELINERDKSKNKKHINQLNQLIDDDRTIHDLVGIIETANAAEIATSNGKLEFDKGNELTSRNVATSRMAELFGLGDMFAHSRKMVVHNNGKTLEGCFMEFAKGDDLSSKNREVQEKFRQLGDLRTPEFNRESSKMEIFDMICGQMDRHGKNMFYQFSEPDENGKRKITGLMGIDNDLAFGTAVDSDSIGYHNPYYDVVTFIDKGLADKIRKIERSDLEFAVGDILSKEEMDAMEHRLKNFQDRLKEEKMVELNPNEWALNEYKLSDYKNCEKINISKEKTSKNAILNNRYVFDFSGRNLSQREMNYANGLLERERCQNDPLLYGIHKFKRVAIGVAGEIKIWDKELEAEAKKAQPVREQIGRVGLEQPIAKETTVENKGAAKTAGKEATAKTEEKKTTEKTVGTQATAKTGENKVNQNTTSTPTRTRVSLNSPKKPPTLPPRNPQNTEQTNDKGQKQQERKSMVKN